MLLIIWPTFTLQVNTKKNFPCYFCSFLSNCLEFKSQILRTHVVILCAPNSLVIVLSVIDSALKKFRLLRAKNVKEIEH